MNYNWVLGVSLAKSVLWIAASVVTIIVSRRHKEKVALAGIRAIFCVQSNDLALGVPIVMALYGRTHPEYVGYLFILQPVTLCFLDPMGSLTLCNPLAYTPLSCLVLTSPARNHARLSAHRVWHSGPASQQVWQAWWRVLGRPAGAEASGDKPDCDGGLSWLDMEPCGSATTAWNRGIDSKGACVERVTGFVAWQFPLTWQACVSCVGWHNRQWGSPLMPVLCLCWESP